MAANGVVSWRRTAEKIDGEGGAHVLAVDDSLVDRKVIERLLKIFSCKVTVVDSGMRALQFLGLDEEKSSSGFNLQGLKVDLIITDYCMPGMTGYELLKKIKESSACREIPVVIMSSENVLTRIHRCLEEGAEDFIVKPVKLSDVERLKDYMSREAVKASVDGSLNGVNKRKFSDGGDENRPSSPASDSPSSESEPLSPPSVLPLSAPCPPSPPLCSPTRRLKMTVKES